MARSIPKRNTAHDYVSMFNTYICLTWLFLFSRNQNQWSSPWSMIDHDVKTLSALLVLCEGNRPVTVDPTQNHDDVIKWKHFPRYWPFVRWIHRSPVNSPHKGQWRGALMFSSICARINGWVNNPEAGDLRRHRAHYDVTVMTLLILLVAR